MAASAGFAVAQEGEEEEEEEEERQLPGSTPRSVASVFRSVRGRLRGMSRLLSERPVRNVLLLVVAAAAFSAVGVVQVMRGVGLFSAAGGAAEEPAVPLLRKCVADVAEIIHQGIANIAQNHHAFPSSTDMLVLLGSIAFVLPAMSRLGLSSSVLANLVLGIVIGPSGFCLFKHVAWSETLAQVGILFFLCEMGLELNIERLKKMLRDVFVLGLAQFVATTWVLYVVGRHLFALPWLQALITGAALSLSSSTFVLQILDSRKERGTRHGRAAFGILLLQDLAVPGLLVLLPMLRDATGGMGHALPAIRQAMLRTFLALAIAAANGRVVLSWLFNFVAMAGSPVALRCLSFFAIFGTCYIFEAFGLPSTLGAFLAGVLLSETAYRQQVESVISPVREDFLGVFFITVGFSIDLQLIFTRPLLVLSTVSTLLLVKSLVTMAVCRAAGLRFANAQQIGLLLSQAGEFSFVLISTAHTLGVYSEQHYKLLVTVVGVSLASTPIFASIGQSLAEFLEQSRAESEESLQQMVPEPNTTAEVVIVGYGRIGRMITQVLDQRLMRWISFDNSPAVVNEARRRDLPVCYGDVLQMLATSSLGDPSDGIFAGVKMVVITLMTKDSMQAAVRLKKLHPNVQVLACAVELNQAKVLEQQGVMPILPTLPEDSMLLNLPIGIAVLDKLGYSEEEINPMVRTKRLELIREEEDRRQMLLDKAGFQETGISADLGTIASWFPDEPGDIGTY